MGLKNNVGKTVGMVCRPFQAAVTHSEAAYRRRMTGAGPSYWDMQRGRVQCTDYGEEMLLGLLAGHMRTQHGEEAGGRRHWETTAPSEEPRTYRMAFLTTKGPRN